ncbi:MAG: hypothetical protein JNK67_27670 [Alphaproteobacteria bacterium]|nr:hypothetical protein [Alphaproteobacteria bacterium]
MSVTEATAAPIVPTKRVQPQPLMVNDDGHMVPGGPSDRSGDDKFKFSDLVALVNPLQHLPIIGPLYRKLTGDEPHPAVKVIGGLIFGGPIGLVNATLNHVFEQTTGKTPVDAIAGLFMGDGEKSAAADPAPAAAGAPKLLIPAAAAALAEIPANRTAAAAPAAAAVTTPPQQTATGTPAAAPPPPAPAAAGWTGTRQPGSRDLAWYLNNAGARMPATLNGATGTGSQGPSVPRNVGPSYVPGASAMSAPAAPRAGQEPLPASQADFLRRLEAAQAKYQALQQQLSRGTASLNRVE